MSIISSHNTNPSNRFHTRLDLRHLRRGKPHKALSSVLKKHSGRNFSGKLTTRHRGGRHKRLLRAIDWRRDKMVTLGRITALEYDPNRTANIALVTYTDGDKRYILAPESVKVGDMIESGPAAEAKPGNCLPLKNIPVGVPIHNIELTPGKGAQIVRSAGSSGLIQSKDSEFASVLLPSREVRLIRLDCRATVGQLSNPDWKNITFGKAGRKRNKGIKPTVRGTAQHPDSHPHGGGEGRSGEGMPPKTPWGKPARGKRTRKRHKYSSGFIVKRRS